MDNIHNFNTYSKYYSSHLGVDGLAVGVKGGSHRWKDFRSTYDRTKLAEIIQQLNNINNTNRELFGFMNKESADRAVEILNNGKGSFAIGLRNNDLDVCIFSGDLMIYHLTVMYK